VRRGLILALALALGGLTWAWLRRLPERSDAPGLIVAPAPSAPAFARALEPRPIELPRDHGPHPEFQSEWWYYTGHLSAAGGARFGFQLTFFRRGLTPGDPPADPGLRASQIWFAHFALTDVAARRHVFFERFARGAGGLAGARAEPFAVELEDWRAQGLDPEGRVVHLLAREGGTGLDLRLSAAKPLALHGERGLSRKSAEPGNASYYVGYTRLAAAGRLVVDGREIDVAGSAWFDHEWSTSALGAGVVGWDWFSLQLDDGRELMFYALRRADGSREPVSAGSLVEPDGAIVPLGAAEVETRALAFWTSPKSGARYPVRWRLSVPRAGLELDVVALIEAQELTASFTYWEGAVDARGTRDGAPVTGRGYVELTGYAASLQGIF
jgi:predicted secreted hydrolase